MTYSRQKIEVEYLSYVLKTLACNHFISSMKKILSFFLFFTLILPLTACDKLGDAESYQIHSESKKAESTDTSPSAKPSTEPAQAWTNDDPAWGDESAPINMVVFSDFQCPFCGEFFQTLEKLEKDWITSGKLKIQHRDFPLTMHLNSMQAHIAANAAAAQGKYMEMHRLLFQHQREWEKTSEPEKLFLAYAEQLGLNIEQFKSSTDDPSNAAEIQADKDDGRSLGVSGTPGFFINGVFYEGALSYEDLVQVLTNKE